MRTFLHEFDEWLTQWTTPAIRWLIYACLIGFIVMAIAPSCCVRIFAASFRTTIIQGQLWQLISYAFIHASFAHIFFNLFSLWMFGTRLERRWGTRTFLRFTLVVIVGSVMTHLLLTPLFGQMHVFILGISGLVYGVLFAYAYYYPDEVVYLQFLLPIRVKYFVIILGVLAFLSSVDTSGGVAHLTHLGGLFFGYLFVRYPRWFAWIPVPDIKPRGWRW